MQFNAISDIIIVGRSCKDTGGDKLGGVIQRDESQSSGRAAAESEEIMKKMLNEIKNRAELVEQLAELLAELDKYPSRMQTDIYALIDEDGNAEAVDYSCYDGYSTPTYYESSAFICSKPAVYESLVQSFYTERGDFSEALGMSWNDFEKLVLQWIEDEDGGLDDDYEVTYDDCLEYAEQHPEVYAQLEEVARDAIDDMKDTYKEVAEQRFFEALENEKDDMLYA